jgi:hypothetical protein
MHQTIAGRGGKVKHRTQGFVLKNRDIWGRIQVGYGKKKKIQAPQVRVG